jgi:hypothetical protein
VSAITHPQTLDLIEQQTASDDFAAVRGFLVDRPDIAEFLVEAQPVIAGYFGDDAVTVLRVEDDPDEEVRYVAVYVQTDDPSEIALGNLHRLIVGWWLDASSGVREDVLLSLDPV